MKKLLTWIKNSKDHLEGVAAILAIAGALAGGVWAIIEYYDAKHRDQVKETLDYVQQFNSSDKLVEAYQHLEKFWGSTINDQGFMKNFLAEHDIEKQGEYTNTLIKEGSPIWLDTVTYIEFFDNLSVCIQSKLCDKDTAVRFFGKNTHDFLSLNYPFILFQRKKYVNRYFGRGVEFLTHEYCLQDKRNCE